MRAITGVKCGAEEVRRQQERPPNLHPSGGQDQSCSLAKGTELRDRAAMLTLELNARDGRIQEKTAVARRMVRTRKACPRSG